MSIRPKIGAYVLETLTTGMYSNPLDAIRELIQNSADAIRKAEDKKILIKGEGRIEIKIDPIGRTLIVRDNGIGVPVNRVMDRLINIGMSDKQIESDAGFRGIGRLAAIAYCDNLIFRTSYVEEDKTSIIQMDCVKLRKSISPAMREVEELADVVSKFTNSSYEGAKTSEHFFEVILEGIEQSAISFLDWKDIEKYLCQVAPVKMDAQHFIFAPKISEWTKQNNIDIPVSTVVIKTPEIEREIFKPYKNRYKTLRNDYEIKVNDIIFFPEQVTAETPYWLWYAKTDLLGTFHDERVAGLRFRKNNIAIGGPDRVAELFSKISETYHRFNSWYIGEIHILKSDVIPNGRRDGFESNKSWLEISSQLSPFIRARCNDAYQSSNIRNTPVQKIKKNAQKVIDEASRKIELGFGSTEEWKQTIEKLDKQQELVSRAIESRNVKSPQDKETLKPIVENLLAIKEKLNEGNPYSIKKLSSTLDRKQRKIIQDILQALFVVLDEENYNKAKIAILELYRLKDNS